MSVCEICGKEIESSETYTISGVTKCRECALKGMTSVIENNKSEQQPESGKDESEEAKKELKNLIMNASNPLIRIMKKLVVIEFFVIIIVSFATSISVGRYNAAVFLVSFIVSAFAGIIATGIQIVFLNLADDVCAIKNAKNKDEKENNE